MTANIWRSCAQREDSIAGSARWMPQIAPLRDAPFAARLCGTCRRDPFHRISARVPAGFARADGGTDLAAATNEGLLRAPRASRSDALP